MHLGQEPKMVHVVGSLNQVRDPNESPGPLLWFIPALAIVAFWEVNDQLEDLSVF